MRLATEPAGGPAAELTVTPRSAEDMAAVLAHATEKGLAVQVLGGGTHSGYGAPHPPDIVVSMSGLTGITAWEPDDMTLVAGGGAPVAGLEEELAGRNQTMVMPERPGGATIGGVIASGVSSLRRGRLYGTRERVLETVAVTGDGRIVRSGGRVVKNVTGYDLSRLHVGAFGSLGVLVSVCLKLWPVPPAAATVTLGEAAESGLVTRPLAVLEERDRTRVFLWGTDAEVSATTSRFHGETVPFLDWPADPEGSFLFSVRVPPGLTAETVGRLPAPWRYLAVHGVGEIRVGCDHPEGVADVRDWAESVGGSVVVVDSPTAGLGDFDPWGRPPPALELQRNLIAQFDPARVINPGRLPGGL
jgi:glycolate oxidase FAD binding subunit